MERILKLVVQNHPGRCYTSMERGAITERQTKGMDGGDVDLWRVQLEGSDHDLAQCLSWLSSDERVRAGRFRFDEHRHAFILSRGVLRALIGRIAGIRPAQVSFSYGARGKPALADQACPLRFNLSHCEKLAAY